MKKNNKLDKNNTQNLPKGDGLSLPKGWEMRKLGEVCEVIAGQSPQSKYYNNNGEGLPFYQGKKEFTNKFIGTPTKWTTKITKEAIKDDILMSVRAPVGPVNFATQKICIGRGLAAIRASKQICIEFLFNFLLKHENEIVGNSGAVFNSINKTQIGAIEIPIPPLSEQKRIVSKLDTLFAEIEALETKTKQNLENTKELFQSYLEGVFDPSTRSGQGSKGDDCGTLSSSKWEEKKLGEVVDFFNGFAFKSRDNVEISNTQVIRMGNLYQNRLSLDRKPAFVPDNFAVEYNRYLLKENDLIISLTGTSGKEDYGYTVKIPKTKKQLLLNQRIAKFVIIDNSVLCKDFLFQFVLSRTFLDELYKTANGTRQANLSTETMKDLSISFPLIEEQQRIVEKLDTLSAETKKLESLYQEKLLSLSELKKSILNKAFKGEI